MFSYKKGGTLSIFLLILILLFIGIVSVGLYALFKPLAEDLSTELDSPQAQAIMNDSKDIYPGWVDGIYMTILVFFMVGAYISSYFADTHKIFFIVFIAISVVLIFTSAILRNVYLEFLLDEDIAAVAPDFPFIMFVWDHLIPIILGHLLIVGALLYAKFKDTT